MVEALRALSPAERAVLDRLCAGGWDGAATARAQADVASFGGRAHAGDDVCFALHVPDGVALLPPHGGGPVVTLSVVDGETVTGIAELWVEDGRLHSVEVSWWVDLEPRSLPTSDQLREDATWQ